MSAVPASGETPPGPTDEARTVSAAGRRPRTPGSFTWSVLGAAARGTGLIALAVAIGIVLLQYSDDTADELAGGREPAAEGPAPLATSSTTTTTAGPRPPAEVTVVALNAAGRAGVAGRMTDRLAVVGYRTLEPGNAPRQPDTEVRCRPGFEREAAALAAATGLPAETGVLPDASDLPGAGEADCAVLIGTG